MNSTRDYGCEIISFIVLFVLSALSHFWYIMILICGGIAIRSLAQLMTRIVLSMAVAPVPEFAGQRGHENARIPNFASGPGQESR